MLYAKLHLLQASAAEAEELVSPPVASGVESGRSSRLTKSPVSPELNAASGQSVLDAAAEFEKTAVRRAKAAEARYHPVQRC